MITSSIPFRSETTTPCRRSSPAWSMPTANCEPLRLWPGGRRPRDCKPSWPRIEQQLAQLVPLAKSGQERAPVNARLNVDRFAPVRTKRLRFTILATNNWNHASTNWRSSTRLESMSRLRARAPGHFVRRHRRWPTGTNCASSTTGTTATHGVGCRTKPARAWIELEFAEEQSIDRVVWGRDREGRVRRSTGHRLPHRSRR